ncbi:efflux RND transporter periplasmic adaptor subunit [Telmatospirillum siberiense]|uniref:Efflux transporter periplasmic adaptor subunit n=1 Tax=Telmatospirillum siberiense TaxID=382514 RepID=A0A2N3PT16_9PROT|nr:efflux RND transporter periplasmic adaptor subunit [Telmatospirillum siberiense]PKU23549.1 efflux transporter periplasmic adaptor subunit [Telmatospirillum siberiense]
MVKRMILMLVLVGLVFGGIFGFEAFRGIMIQKFMASMGGQPQTVATTKAEVQEWQPHLEAIGSLRAVKGADLSLETSGVVDVITFNSGDDVPAGAVLLRLRDADDVAKLQSLEATAELAQITYRRDEQQLQAHAISQATLDSDAAALKSARAQVAEQRAVVDKKVLKAPFAGHLGIRSVDLGQYLTAGTAIVTLQALDPIFVDFTMPQQALAQLSVGLPVSVAIDTYPDKRFTGKIAAINPKVDTASRNVQIRATLANPAHKLLPGMFAKVTIDTGAPERYVTLPQTAITFSPYGDTAYLVENKGQDEKGQPQLIAHQTFITTGAKRGDQVAVAKGIKEGDTVVVAGQIKLRNGSPLLIDNSVRPANEANPVPVDK